MRIQELTEGLSPVLYHATNISTAGDIITTNRFRLTPDMGTSSEEDNRIKGKIYYLSTARSKTGSYAFPVSKHKDQGAMLVLDGRALMAAGHTGKAIDYWGPAWRDQGKNELEDRIYSDKAFINNATKFIKEIHILFSYEPGSNDYNRFGRRLKDWLFKAKQAGIDVYIYTDQNAFGLLNKAKAKRMQTLTPDADPLPLPGSKGKEDSRFYQHVGRNYFGPFIEMLNVDDKSKLSSRARKELYNLHYADKAASISADIHNARTGRNRGHLDKFLAQLKKFGITTVQELIDYLNNKFR